MTPADGDQTSRGQAPPPRSRSTPPPARTHADAEHRPGPRAERLVYASSDLFSIRTATYNGPDLAATSLMDAGHWTTDQQLPTPESGVREPHLTAGAGGVWLTYAQKIPLDDHVRVRRFDAAGNSFGAPRSLESTADTADATIDGVSSSQDASGRVHVVWQTHLTTSLLRYTRSDAGGGTFAAPGTLATGTEDYEHPYVATGPDAAGWIAWQGNGDSPIRVMRLEASALGEATDSSVTSSSATTTRTARSAAPRSTSASRPAASGAAPASA